MNDLTLGERLQPSLLLQVTCARSRVRGALMDEVDVLNWNRGMARTGNLHTGIGIRNPDSCRIEIE